MGPEPCSPARAPSWGGRGTLGSLHWPSHPGPSPLASRMVQRGWMAPLWPEAALGVFVPHLLGSSRPCSPFSHSPRAHLPLEPISLSKWGPGPSTQAGGMSDTDVSRVTPCRQSSGNKAWPWPQVWASLWEWHPLGRRCARAASAIMELRELFPPHQAPSLSALREGPVLPPPSCPTDSWGAGGLPGQDNKEF